jgi:putative tryptophan/tyrosine transport system substrate-binding protein
MRRRDFALLICSATMAPRVVFAQATSRLPVVGSLWLGTKDAPSAVSHLGQFLAGMRELGYAEGENFESLARFADFHANRMPQLATEFVQLKPDVILAAASIQAVSRPDGAAVATC